MFNLIPSAPARRRSRRQQRILKDASRAFQVERLEERALLASIPQLNSLAGAPVTIYLDFDGHTETDPGWTRLNNGNPIVIPHYDTNGDYGTLTDAEADEIYQIWAQVAEDYAPFDVNVTTLDPGSFNNFEAVRVSTGGRGFVAGAGGIAFLNSFSNSASNTSFAFSEVQGSVFNVAMTISHEAGHQFGLRHHSQFDANGNKQQEYHPGNGEIGPIMGAPFGVVRALWDNGPANTTVDDLQADLEHMTRPGNRTFKFREDEHANTRNSQATSPDFDDDGNIALTSVLERNTDVDTFVVETDAGTIRFAADTLDLRTDYGSRTPGANLDVILRLYDFNDTLLEESDPADSFSASLEATVPQGTYYVEVATGDLYGSVGQYDFSGQIVPLPTSPEMITPKGITGDATPLFSWTQTASTASYELQVNNKTTGQEDVIRQLGIKGTSFVPTNSLPEGDFEARVRSVNKQGKESDWSEFINFSIDVPPPGVPTPLSPRGRVTTPRPEFLWEAADGAASYELTVKRDVTEEVVIFRTGTTGTSYTHFNALNDGKYKWSVRAVNDVGEKGVPSRELNFTVEVAKAEVPVITAPDPGKTSILRPTITWTAVINAETYELRVHNRSSGETNFIREEGLKKTEYKHPTRMPQGTYEIDVRAFDALDRASKWSESVTVTIDVPHPTKPRLTGPDGDPVETQKPLITWKKAKRAKKYVLVVLDRNQDDAEVLRKTIKGAKVLEFQTTRKLPQSSDLVALLASVNVVGERSAFDEFEFGIDVPEPKRPTVTGPRKNSNGTVADTKPTFSWTAVEAAVSYDLKVRNRRTGKVVIRENSVKGTEFTPTKALAEESEGYEVTVRARNSAGELSQFSKKYVFILDVPTPETPTMFGPNGDTSARRPTAEWENVNAAVKYQLFVKALNTNSTKQYNVKDFDLSDDGQIASFRIPDKLAKGTYQAWVRALNSSNEKSGYSNQVTFTIVSADTQPIFVMPVDPDEAVAEPAADPRTQPTNPVAVDAAEAAMASVSDTTVLAPQADVVQTEAQSAESEALATAMAEFADQDWVAPAENDEGSDADTTEATSLAIAGLAVPFAASRLIRRLRRRREE